MQGGDITYTDMNPPALEPSRIGQYFAGTNVFITGATGFLGKLLLEKLLWSCPEMKMVYVLVREKKGKTTEKRFEELMDNVLFERLKREQPNYVNKIELVTGDCILPEMGLNEKDKQKLVGNVHCIFHCAATVRFDEKIRTASYINVRATRDLLVLAKEMKQLKSFLYISTAYSNCIRNEINEEFYEHAMTGSKLLTLVDTLNDEELEKITPTIIGEWPNTYVFTKAVAEEVVKTGGRGLPIAVIRPSIVISTSKEPVAGWIENMYGITGITVGVAVGLIRTLYLKADNVAETVPADFVVNCSIAAAWQIGTTKGATRNKEMTNESDIPIYNYVSSTQTPITWRTIMKLTKLHLEQVPSPLEIWHHFLILTSNSFMHMLWQFLLHTVPAYIVDFFARCLGKPPFAVKGYKKIHKLLKVISYFGTRQWTFRSNNTQSLWKKLNEQDQKWFDFDMTNFDWDSYLYTLGRGGRVYLMKDPLDTIPEGRKTYLKLQIAHYALVTFLFLILLKLLMVLYSVIF